jgi:hypothetical protein
VLLQSLSQYVAGLPGINGAVLRPADQFHVLLQLFGIELLLDDVF